MPKWDRSRWRAAERIVQSLLARRAAPPFPCFPYQQIQSLHLLRKRWDHAVRQGWLIAAATSRNTWEMQLEWLINDLKACRTAAPPSTSLIPTTAQVYRDLAALEDEFELVVVDPKAQTVTVHTDRIVLERLDLGPFAIAWNWSRAENTLRVVAQEPRYANHDETIPHPHVRDDELCLGEGEVPLDQAFRSGRLCDAFLIVQQILKTYNADSAYASLGRWTGTTCSGCASDMDADESCSCEGCGESFCGGCIRSCASCGDTVCHDCSTLCPECGNRICSGCLVDVDDGRRQRCQACQDDSTLEEEPEDEADETTPPPESGNPPTDTHLHADRVVEASLSAGHR